MNEASASASARRSASVSATAIQLSFPVLFGGASVGESFEGLTSGGATGWSACGAIWWFSTSNSISSDSSAPLSTVFENHRKSLIQNCKRRSELHLHFE